MNALTTEEIENLERFRHGLSIELEQAADMIRHGQTLPLNKLLHASIKNIKNILAEAKKDGVQITSEAWMIICADETKRVFKNRLSNYTHTLFEVI
ncbi:hypothetical protein KMZ15_06650 [Mycoavidus sp. HKI]|uniref:hypothetical protein n=1 Tax=Mycoavidus sp. HKI TaxID=2840467 RepID=UPI001CBC9302|nr:hypothetical protein [Mycoavidus sp. HKI]UAW63746.1 hypothetical protein KMZ15_06650 [Mycoavidus sp. HKI]